MCANMGLSEVNNPTLWALSIYLNCQKHGLTCSTISLPAQLPAGLLVESTAALGVVAVAGSSFSKSTSMVRARMESDGWGTRKLSWVGLRAGTNDIP